VERPVGDPGPLGRREVQPDSAGLSHFYERGEAGTGRGGGHSERGVRGGATGGGGAARSWGESPLFLPTPSFMASAEKE